MTKPIDRNTDERVTVTLPLFRAFKADHNLLTELPYDFSQLLQKNTNLVTLGDNLWHCSCNAEITGTVSTTSGTVAATPRSLARSVQPLPLLLQH